MKNIAERTGQGSKEEDMRRNREQWQRHLDILTILQACVEYRDKRIKECMRQERYYIEGI